MSTNPKTFNEINSFLSQLINIDMLAACKVLLSI